MFINSFHLSSLIASVTTILFVSCKTDDTHLLAEEGDPMAQYELGIMYQNGEGVPQNYSKAVKWFRKSAEKGDAAAQLSLARIYDKGHGVQQNDILAFMWSNLAARWRV